MDHVPAALFPHINKHVLYASSSYDQLKIPTDFCPLFRIQFHILLNSLSQWPHPFTNSKVSMFQIIKKRHSKSTCSPLYVRGKILLEFDIPILILLSPPVSTRGNTSKNLVRGWKGISFTLLMHMESMYCHKDNEQKWVELCEFYFFPFDSNQATFPCLQGAKKGIRSGRKTGKFYVRSYICL